MTFEFLILFIIHHHPHHIFLFLKFIDYITPIVMSWQPVSVASTSVQHVSSLSHIVCDPMKELVWSGSSMGSISCLYSPQLELRMRVQAQPRNSHLLHLSLTAEGLLSSSTSGVRFHSRGGILRSEFDSTRSCFHQLTAAAAMDYSNELLLAGVHINQIPSASSLDGYDEAVMEYTHGLALLDIATNQIVTQVSHFSSHSHPFGFSNLMLQRVRLLTCSIYATLDLMQFNHMHEHQKCSEIRFVYSCSRVV